MTMEELRKIRNPDLTVEEILGALSKDERDALANRLLRDVYPMQSMDKLWASLSTGERASLIRTITCYMLEQIIKEESENEI